MQKISKIRYFIMAAFMIVPMWLYGNLNYIIGFIIPRTFMIRDPRYFKLPLVEEYYLASLFDLYRNYNPTSVIMEINCNMASNFDLVDLMIHMRKRGVKFYLIQTKDVLGSFIDGDLNPTFVDFFDGHGEVQTPHGWCSAPFYYRNFINFKRTTFDDPNNPMIDYLEDCFIFSSSYKFGRLNAVSEDVEVERRFTEFEMDYADAFDRRFGLGSYDREQDFVNNIPKFRKIFEKNMYRSDFEIYRPKLIENVEDKKYSNHDRLLSIGESYIVDDLFHFSPKVTKITGCFGSHINVVLNDEPVCETFYLSKFALSGGIMIPLMLKGKIIAHEACVIGSLGMFSFDTYHRKGSVMPKRDSFFKQNVIDNLRSYCDEFINNLFSQKWNNFDVKKDAGYIYMAKDLHSKGRLIDGISTFYDLMVREFPGTFVWRIQSNDGFGNKIQFQFFDMLIE